jgi:hypothetical protein
MSIAWIIQERLAFEWDSSPKWLWMYFHDPTLGSRLDTMSTVDIFIVFMWPVMISLILSSDTFDCSGESPCTTKVGRISSRYGAFICDVGSTCVSQRGIQREWRKTWHESTNGQCFDKPLYDSVGFHVTYPATDLLVGDVFNKAAVWFWRCPCDVVAVKSHDDFEEAARTLTSIKDGCCRFVPCLVRPKCSGPLISVALWYNIKELLARSLRKAFVGNVLAHFWWKCTCPLSVDCCPAVCDQA